MRKRAAVGRQKPGAARSRSTPDETVAGVRLTHPDRVLYPDQGITKRELARYFQSAAKAILPHLSGRPLALVRCPRGQGESCFFQKHSNDAVPEVIHRVRIQEKNRAATYLTVDSPSGLVALAQIGALELHTWGSRVGDLERPDRIVFDLDPDPEVSWQSLIDAAARLREILGELGLESFVKTTGGKGLHVQVPIRPEVGWDEVKEFSRDVALVLIRDAPDRYTASMARSARPGKIFIDYLRNVRGATAIAPYSPRAKPGAPIAAPITWKELEAGVRSDRFSVRDLKERLEANAWKGYQRVRQSLELARARLAAR